MKWKEIIWHKNYKVSEDWKIKNSSTWRVLNYRCSYEWDYGRVMLYENWEKYQYSIHRLVAQAFLWLDITKTKILVCHKDDIKTNNHKDNLFLWTHSDNAMDSSNKGRHFNKWRFWKKSKLSIKVVQYDLDWYLIKIWDSISDTKRAWFNNVSKCCKWKQNTDKWYMWEYFVN